MSSAEVNNITYRVTNLAMFSCEFTCNPPSQEQTFWQEIQRYNANQKLSSTHTHSHKPTGSKANSTLNQYRQYVAVEFTCK